VRHDWSNPVSVVVDDSGVQGRITMILADLDYDKDVRLVYTTDNWETTNEMLIGTPGSTNAFYWVADMWNGYEQWAVDIDLPDVTDRFEYAVLYRHGVVNGADEYDFWDNNGGHNYVIDREE
jgi:hypothetical protein